VYRWLDGRNPDLVEANGVVDDLAEFVNAMRRIDTSGAPEAWRGKPLATQAGAMRHWVAAQDDTVDTDAAMRVWERALTAEEWTGPPLWFHGDLMRGNLLVRNGRLVAVIDFATAGAGDPAIDLLPAWALFDADARERFRAAVDADDAMWERSRGWAVLLALGAVAYYRETNELLYSTGRRALDALFAG
jgi:aminoglycoside phosphotransferase (APT) family kinase protein